MRQLKPLLIFVTLIVAATLWSGHGLIPGVTNGAAPSATANHTSGTPDAAHHYRWSPAERR
jgi:hypothetical protein